MKFKTKIKTRIKEIRNDLCLSQQDLADGIGVSRQTIYFLEKGKYNPSLTISFKIAEVLNRPLNEIFYQEPIIKDELKEIKYKKPYKEVEDFINTHGIDHNTLFLIGDIDEKELSKSFSKEFLEKLAEFLGYKFDDLFIDAEI
ncbi:MAG: helix-turn-helix transcriptional regulator [Candidatus Odinarchaeota archaeon]